MTPAPRYLLDTDTLSNLIRNPHGSVKTKIARRGEGLVCTSIIVASELRFGAAKRGSQELVNRVESLLVHLNVVSLAPPVDEHYAAIRAHLENEGTMIGPNDLLIAAHARALGCVVITGNMAEFQRVPSLDCENWIE